ncbi:hypothetical protein N657DRAFT_651817 [Parathielavia appendiculata]|uniref:VOC domain-containing protein n=1 Tax=Parathielavia appendiculata TaxID=2587402 RepID=A0AAN6Z8B9_9PEZI|nr:hypothetical protein N657DRAFT_651817 [Parathielavia appendiculata]
MSNWKPPKFGSPVWLGISAKDVSRAEQFYATVFNWTYRDVPASDGQSDQTKTRLFDFNPDVSLSGGLLHQPAKAIPGAPAAGPGGTCVFWLVEDVDKIATVIEQAGGKMVGSQEPIKEGKSGLYRYFEDTEGNVGAVYQFLGSS